MLHLRRDPYQTLSSICSTKYSQYKRLLIIVNKYNASGSCRNPRNVVKYEICAKFQFSHFVHFTWVNIFRRKQTPRINFNIKVGLLETY